MRGKTLLVLAGLLGAGLLGYRNLPPHLNPLAPLALDDPPGWLTSFKLRRLTADQCASLLAEANRRRLIASRPVADSEGSCPLRNVVRVANFGSVQLSSSFLASCPLALSSALYIEQQAKPLTRQLMASDLRQIDHLG
ncbi:extensin family protein, partial [Klebsiella pneumoniae]|nr:extensin family protein [Klebsiella pneumoniae]